MNLHRLIPEFETISLRLLASPNSAIAVRLIENPGSLRQATGTFA